jgi:hypothetical protein
MENNNRINTPLKLFQPMELLAWVAIYSPIVLATSITSLSFVFQNFKGMWYLVSLLIVAVCRNWTYALFGANPSSADKNICENIQYSPYGNSSFSAFVFAYTIMYISLPMFMYGAINFWIFIPLIVWFLSDVFIKIYKKCIVNLKDVFLNILLGLVIAGLLVGLVIPNKQLFFNEVSSNKEICYQPKEQTFKCQVYKDGTLVGNI